MNTIADLLLLLSLAGLITGLVKPSLFVKAIGHTKATRKTLSMGFGAVILVSLVMLAVFSPKPPVKQVPQQQTAAQTTPATTQTDNTTLPANTDTTTQSQPAPAPTLRQDLAFQGDPTYCDGRYKANSDGTTTWTLDIKQAGEIITHLSDNSGHLYRHDVQVSAGEYSYTAPVNISDVSEITGLLYVGSDSHPCNINPQS